MNDDNTFTPMIEPEELRRYAPDEQGMAELFIDRFAPIVRHCPASGRWYVFDSQRWLRDDSAHLIVQEYVVGLGKLVKETHRQAHQKIAVAKHAKGQDEALENGIKALERHAKLMGSYADQFRSRSKVRSIIGLASSIMRIRVEPEDLDKDPYLINFRNGVFDVRTGLLRPHDPADLITQVADYHLPTELLDPAVLLHEIEAPLWKGMLLRLCDGDTNLAISLERAEAYGLLGHNPEQVIFLLVGAPNTGKSKSLEIVADLFKDYSVRSSRDLITVSGQRHDSHGASLRGKRFSVISETEERMTLDSAQVKEQTGSSKVNTRALYHEQEEARVTWTIFISTNATPQLSDPDDAVFRRVRLLPMSNTRLDEREVDQELPEKIMEQEGAIVCARLMRQAHEWWQARQASAADPSAPTTGLLYHPKIRNATDAYKVSSDSAVEFALEHLDLSDGHEDRSSEVLHRYKAFCKDNELTALGRNTFWKRLEQATGCVRDSRGVLHGARLKTPMWRQVS